jgi:hypothetical protein
MVKPNRRNVRSLFWNSGHVVEATTKLPMNADVHPFGLLNPLHYLL